MGHESMSVINNMAQKLSNKVVFFDIDGVLVDYHFGINKINVVPDSEYIEYCKHNDVYENARPLKTMQTLINKLNPDNVYVLSVSFSEPECNYKKAFIKRNYPTIHSQNIMFTLHKENKISLMLYVRDKLRIRDEDMVIVDDSVDILDNVEKNSEINCYHISSFIE